MKTFLPAFRRSLGVTVCLATLMAQSPAAPKSDDAFYDELAKSRALAVGFEPDRTPTGIDFNSKEKIELNGKPHPRFHFEIEGPLAVPPDITSLDKAVRLLGDIIKPEVDTAHEEKDPVQPGVGGTIVDVNGTKVAFLQYKNSKEPDTYDRRAILYEDGHVISATMTLHNVPENDRTGMFLFALIIELVNLRVASPAQKPAATPAGK